MSENNRGPEIRVINEEYERVLSNPDNIIVSDELQQLIDLPLDDASESEMYSDAGPESIDTASLTILNAEGLPVTVRGELSELSYSGEAYTIAIRTENVRQGFLEALDSDTRKSNDMQLIVGGVYESDLTVKVHKWKVQAASPHSREIKLYFRSENGIF